MTNQNSDSLPSNLLSSNPSLLDSEQREALLPLPDPKYIYHASDVPGEDVLFEFAQSGAVDDGCPSCERLYTKEQVLECARQAAQAQAPAVPDLSLSTHEKMRKLMTRLGIATEESMETFAAKHESNLLYLIMCANSFMDRVIAAAPSAPIADRNAIIEEIIAHAKKSYNPVTAAFIANDFRALKTAEGEKADRCPTHGGGE